MSRLIVVDCSVSAAWVLHDERSAMAEKVLSDITKGKVSLVVPALWWYEIANVLRTAVKRKRTDNATAQKALFLLRKLPMETIGPEKQGESGILSMALTHGLSAYDASYLHCALSSGAELIAADQDLLQLRPIFKFIKHLDDYSR